MRKAVIIGAGIVIVSSVIAVIIGIQRGIITEPTTEDNVPIVFSNQRMLGELYSTYKRTILEPGTLRALDNTQEKNLTTSEGQSYTMMRAVWSDDQDTFSQVWQWTKDNMQRDDKLISWRFGQLPDGRYGVQTDNGGQNTATDADVDIAYALIMASNRWKTATYLYDADAMINAIWQKEVVLVNGQPTLASNDIERNNTESILINPSYFAPYAYRIFAKVDPAHDWNGVVDSSYSLLAMSSDAKLDMKSSSGLVPDWARLDRTTGTLTADTTLSTTYGYDAFRTPWRLALDYRYNKEPRARQILEKFSRLQSDWDERTRLASIYRHDGSIETDDSVPASYGANLGYFMIESPNTATDIYRKQLLSRYNPDSQSWDDTLSYYDDNWAWFGMALYLEQLPDLAGLYEQ